MAKLYFQKHSECCYTLEYHKWYMEHFDIETLELFEAKREAVSGYRFCKEFCQTVESSDCGKHCEEYRPNNGKNGRCTHFGYTYEQTDKTLFLTHNSVITD